MHLHRSFDDGGSPSSTKRQSSASTSWAWIMFVSVASAPRHWSSRRRAARLLWVVAWSAGGDHCVGAVPLCRAARLGGPSPKAALRKGCVWLPQRLRPFCVRSWKSRWGVALVFVVGRLGNELAGDKPLGSQERAWVSASLARQPLPVLCSRFWTETGTAALRYGRSELAQFRQLGDYTLICPAVLCSRAATRRRRRWLTPPARRRGAKIS